VFNSHTQRCRERAWYGYQVHTSSPVVCYYYLCSELALHAVVSIHTLEQ